jgi:hypothetical protein
MRYHRYARQFGGLLKNKSTDLAVFRSNPRLRFRPSLERLEVRPAPAVYTVTDTADGLGTITSTGPDTFDASTLRAAVIAANANPGADTIMVPAGTYVLTIAGDLNITDSVTIVGAGADTTHY